MSAAPHRLPELLAQLIRRLRQGRPAAGAPFPTKHALALELGIAPVTAQRLLRQLQEWGYLDIRPRQGSHVVRHLPHRHRFGLALYDQREHLSAHCWALAAAARQESTTEASWELFYGAPDATTLADALALNRLGGLYLPLASAFPRIAQLQAACPIIGLPPTLRGPRILLDQDHDAFITHAAQALLLAGRTRIAVLADDLKEPDLIRARITQAQAALGFQFQPAWLQGGPLARPTWVWQTLMLLSTAGGPDGLIVLDDHFLPMLDAFFRAHPARGMAAVVLANAPNRYPPPAAGIRLLGWDMRTALRTIRTLFDDLHERQWPLVERSLAPEPIAAGGTG